MDWHGKYHKFYVPRSFHVIKGKGLLFNVGSLQKSPPGMDGKRTFQELLKTILQFSRTISLRKILILISLKDATLR